MKDLMWGAHLRLRSLRKRDEDGFKLPEERPAIPRQPVEPVDILSENVYTDINAIAGELEDLRSDCKEWANSTMLQAATLGAVAENNAEQADALVAAAELTKTGLWALQNQITFQARKIENVSLSFEALLKRVNSVEQTNLARIRSVESEIKALRGGVS